MPTVFTHALVGAAACYAVARRPQPQTFWALALGCAMLPDLDVLAFFLSIPYAHPLGHRGFFHSPFFGLLVGFWVALHAFPEIVRFSGRWWFYLVFFSLLTASHGILDAFTNGGLGIALLAPFDHTRYFFPWTPIEVSPIGLRGFLTEQGWLALKSEMLWVWLPVVLPLTLIGAVRRWKDHLLRTPPPHGGPVGQGERDQGR